ncbi:MAG: GFA family protein [Alphaproteobacteria bacterium]|nr:GFA family protein [Alphaproteobacteria bacterium]
MSKTWSGGCQCGAVRYELLERPTGAHICHCRMCQKAFGSFFAPLVGLPRAKFRVTRGEMSNFHSSADVQRGFCKACGTPLTFDDLTEDRISVSIGSLDEHSAFMPENQYGLESREPWFNEITKIPAYDSGEGAEGVTAYAARLPGFAATNRQHPDHDTKDWPPKR